MPKKSSNMDKILILAGVVAVAVSAFLFFGVYENSLKTMLFNPPPVTSDNMPKLDCIAPEDRPKKEKQIQDLTRKIGELYTDLIRVQGEISRMEERIDRAERQVPAPSIRELESLKSQLRLLNNKESNLNYQIQMREDRIMVLEKELKLDDCGPFRRPAGLPQTGSTNPL